MNSAARSSISTIAPAFTQASSSAAAGTRWSACRPSSTGCGKTLQPQAGQEIRIDYLQIPLLLRLNAGSGSASGAALYGIVGPAFDFKIADEVEGFTLDDGIEGTDVSLVFGGGFEVAHIIIEGRYEKGFRRINKTFSSLAEIKKQSFTILFGVRFK